MISRRGRGIYGEEKDLRNMSLSSEIEGDVVVIEVGEEEVVVTLRLNLAEFEIRGLWLQLDGLGGVA